MKSSCFSNLIFFEILLIAFARPFHPQVSFEILPLQFDGNTYQNELQI